MGEKNRKIVLEIGERDIISKIIRTIGGDLRTALIFLDPMVESAIREEKLDEAYRSIPFKDDQGNINWYLITSTGGYQVPKPQNYRKVYYVEFDLTILNELLHKNEEQS